MLLPSQNMLQKADFCKQKSGLKSSIGMMLRALTIEKILTEQEIQLRQPVEIENICPEESWEINFIQVLSITENSSKTLKEKILEGSMWEQIGKCHSCPSSCPVHIAPAPPATSTPNPHCTACPAPQRRPHCPRSGCQRKISCHRADPHPGNRGVGKNRMRGRDWWQRNWWQCPVDLRRMWAGIWRCGR